MEILMTSKATRSGEQLMFFQEGHHANPHQVPENEKVRMMIVGSGRKQYGLNVAEPQIMARDAIRLGIDTDKEVGWIKYSIPKEVSITTRMHLSREQVKELLPILQKFAETGEID